MKKEKGVIIADLNTSSQQRGDDDGSDGSNPVKISIPKASSKYDFVKVNFYKLNSGFSSINRILRVFYFYFFAFLVFENSGEGVAGR